MNRIRALFDNNEYFEFSYVYGYYNVSNNIATKSLTLSAVSVKSFKDFVIALNDKKVMLADIYIDNKLYISGFVNNGNFSYSDSANGGTNISIDVNDRFNALNISDIIETKPQGTLQNFIASILKELDFTSSKYINTYNKKIKKASDFLRNGKDVDIQKLKTFTREDIVEKSALMLLGEALSIHKLLLISNGYDTLTLEKANSYLDPVFEVRRDNKYSNVSKSSKAPNNKRSPYQTIILNSSQPKNEDITNKTDSYTSLIVPNSNGIPHIREVRHVSLNATYEDLAKSVNFRFAGITAQENSFVYNIDDNIFDDYNDFFQPNRLVSVYDEKYGINSNMQILQNSFTIDANSGSSTILNLTTQNAFNNQSTVKQKKSLMKR